MRKLHLVGFTANREGLIFSGRKGSKSGGFVVPLEKKLLAAIAEAQGGDNGAGPAAAATDVASAADPAASATSGSSRSQSALTPREMQSRLRAGRTIEEVAAEAHVDTEWVGRFAVPIVAEQAKVVELARTIVYSKPRLGDSSETLGESVSWNLVDRGVHLPEDMFDSGWSAFQLHNSVWVVRFRYQSRSRQHEATWELDVPAGRLVARDRLASELGYMDKSRRRRSSRPAAVAAGVHTGAPPQDAPGEPDARRALRRRARVTRPAKAPAKPASAAKKTVVTPASRKPRSQAATRAGSKETRTKATKSPPVRRAAAKATGGGAKAAGANKTAGAKTAGAKTAGRKSASKSSAPSGRRSSPAPPSNPGAVTTAAEAGDGTGLSPRSPGVRAAVARVAAAQLEASRGGAGRLVFPTQRAAPPRSSVAGNGRARVQPPPSRPQAQPAAHAAADGERLPPSRHDAQPAGDEPGTRPESYDARLERSGHLQPGPAPAGVAPNSRQRAPERVAAEGATRGARSNAPSGHDAGDGPDEDEAWDDWSNLVEPENHGNTEMVFLPRPLPPPVRPEAGDRRTHHGPPVGHQ